MFQKRQTRWKRLIKKHGLDHVINNIDKFLFYKPIAYSDEYKRQLGYVLRKRYGRRKKRNPANIGGRSRKK